MYNIAFSFTRSNGDSSSHSYSNSDSSSHSYSNSNGGSRSHSYSNRVPAYCMSDNKLSSLTAICEIVLQVLTLTGSTSLDKVIYQTLTLNTKYYIDSIISWLHWKAVWWYTQINMPQHKREWHWYANYLNFV